MTPERALVERVTALLATQDHQETCGFRLYGPPAICLCAAKLPLADALGVISALTTARQREEEAKAKLDDALTTCFQAGGMYAKVILERDALRAENDRLTLAASEAQAQAESWRLGLSQANDKLLELQTAASESARTLQVRIAELEAGERHCDEYHGELADQVTALREVEKAARALFEGPPESSVSLRAAKAYSRLEKALADLPQDGA